VHPDPRELDALLEDRGGGWWSAFFTERAKDGAAPCPLLVDWPDESLVSWFSQGLLAPGRVLELGCGNGRNAVHLASLGCTVDAVDFSERAVEWTQQRAKSARAAVTVQCCSIFDATFPDGSYDLVYDSGCFHHLPPHRRNDYVELVDRALKPGGSYGLVCFRPEGGSGYTDQQVYERASLGGGLGYSESGLRAMWDLAPFRVRELRQMRETDIKDQCFGQGFLWVLLASKRR
jgi:SAM-dependent methyltransferase